MPGRGLVLADSEYPGMIITETIVPKCTFYYLPKLLSWVVSMVLLSIVGLYPLLCITVVMLGYDWWLCMMININIYHRDRTLANNYC